MEFSRTRTIFHVGFILLSCFLYFLLHNNFQKPGDGEHEQPKSFSRSQGRVKSGWCPPGVPLMTPENLTIYLNYQEHQLDSEIEDKVNRIVWGIPQKSRTVILDCPSSSVLPTPNSSSDVSLSSPMELESIYLLLLEAIAKYNQHQSNESFPTVIKVWLRLRDKSGRKGGHESQDNVCSKFAQIGNEIFPGTVVGLLGNLESPLIAWAEFNPGAWERNMEWLKDNGLELGLILEDYRSCEVAQYLNTENVMNKFSVVYFYSQYLTESWHWRNGETPTFEAKVPFEECKSLFESSSAIAEKVQLAINNIGFVGGKFCLEY